MYPYNFEPTLRGLNPEEVFVVMPFDSKYDTVFKDLIEVATGRAAEKLKRSLRAYRTKGDPRTTSGWIEVLEHLFPAQVVLGVLTVETNANVHYELGIAHSTQPLSRQVLIAEDGYRPQFDTKDLIFLRYDPGNPAASVDSLAERIETALTSWSQGQERVVRHAIARLSPYDFEVVMAWGHVRSFAVKTTDGGPADYYRRMAALHAGDRDYMDGVFGRHCEAIARLQEIGLLGLETNPAPGGVTFSYWWTDLGNMVLAQFNLIDDSERRARFARMPSHLRRV
jgi:hypothetical protein